MAAMLVIVAAVAAAGWIVFGRPRGADPDDGRLVARGQRLYAAHCAECHGANLEGQPHWRTPNPDGTLPAPPHDDEGHTWHHPDELLFRYTKLGGQAVVPEGFKSAMPAFAGTLSDDDVWAVLSFIKSRWSPAVRARQARMNP
jgi:mono/diheme cytochrome c family protein